MLSQTILNDEKTHMWLETAIMYERHENEAATKEDAATWGKKKDLSFKGALKGEADAIAREAEAATKK